MVIILNYPGNAKKQYNKPVSYGNRGMILEDMINNSNQYYLDRDIAVIYKKPTPIQIVDTKIDTKGKMITKAFFKEPSTLDYNGLYKGKYIDFDAKETQRKFGLMIEEYIKSRKNVKCVFLLVDFRHKAQENDILMYNYLKYYEIPTVIVATKFDKVKSNAKVKTEKALLESLNILPQDQFVAFSSITKKGREEIFNILSSYMEDGN